MRIPNRPTPEGRELGRCLARFAEQALHELAQTGIPDARCHTCAFRLGTVPNGCPTTLMDALKCVMEHTPFDCHEAATPCFGWLAMLAASPESPPAQAPWGFESEPGAYDDTPWIDRAKAVGLLEQEEA